MDNNRKLAYIVAYYLSKFDKEAFTNLGFSTNKEAFHVIGESLQIPPNYIKFRRDEFDVAHMHRKGWYQRPLSANITNTIKELQHLDEYTLRNLVKDILQKNSQRTFTEEYKELFSIFPTQKTSEKKYTPRNITGRKAEEFFMKWQASNPNYFLENTEMKDVRDHGCGYDFEIKNENETYAIEVKGISAQEGGILFTQKEWETARRLADKYILVIISDIDSENPSIRIFKNPYNSFNPKQTIQRVIQVNWNLSANEIKEYMEREQQ